jgi:uncharacterized protein (TIGR03000 family)
MHWLHKTLIGGLLATILWLGAAASADAHGYRWHGGWGWSGVRVGWGGYHWGRYHHHHYHGWYGPRFGIGISLGYPWYGWGYSYRPYYSYGYAYSPFYPYYYGASYSVVPSVALNYYSPPVVINPQPPVIIGSASPAVPAAPSVIQPAQPVQPSNGLEQLPPPNSTETRSARIEVTVPDPNADVWFGNYRTKTKGTKRVFETPVLQPGKPYSYSVTAQWTEKGVVKRETRRIGVQPGGTSTTDFSNLVAPAVPPAPGEQMPTSLRH